MHVTLQKREKGQPWPSAIAGHAPLDPLKTEQEKQRLMLERFQEEVRSTWESNADSNIFSLFLVLCYASICFRHVVQLGDVCWS